ncbi:MAG TPA: LLM class F420-dependent oxidoreductase [Acidimicrobiia bacterium]|nr:LLM class F420-dependent oxidoreductase [Acidimicrobiia bacterium]
MSIEIGDYGIWQRSSDTTPEVAREAEKLGYGALWVGGSPDGRLGEIERLLDATESLPVATGIVNMWRSDASTVAGSYHRINERHPGRFLLGVGIGHPEATAEYRKPYDTIVEYLDALDAADVPRDHVILAALGPRVLELSAQRTAGAHPYLTTPRHTRMARQVMGPGPLIASEQTVIVGSGDDAAETARRFVSRYLGLVNYRTNLLREGWDEDDVANGGSDRLVDELVLRGTAEDIATGIRAHLDAGADHVTIQSLGGDPLASLRALAGVL